MPLSSALPQPAGPLHDGWRPQLEPESFDETHLTACHFPVNDAGPAVTTALPPVETPLQDAAGA